jgi:hypothetical protein
MDAGDEVMRNGVTDGENGNTGYGCNGTTSYAARWTTAYTVTSTVNPFATPAEVAAAYTAQTSGNLIDWRDNVFFSNLRTNAYNEANTRLVFAGGGGTANANNAIVTSSPITTLTRGAAATPNGSNTTSPVTFIDPTPANDALTAVEFAPNDGFFTPARFRGAFPRGNNWLIGWTGLSAFGLTSSSQAATFLEGWTNAAPTGVPVHYTTGTWAGGTNVTFGCDNAGQADPVGAPGLSIGVGILAFGPGFFPLFGGTLLVDPFANVQFGIVGVGSLASGPLTIPPGFSGTTLYSQFILLDAPAAGGLTLSNAQKHLLP